MGLMRQAVLAGGLAVTAALASAAYQTAGSRRDRQRFPPPGHMVDIGGRRIHLWRQGVGSPTVVLVPALGAPSLDFAALLPSLAEETSTVIFDRAGLGWSDPVSGSAGLLNAAADLHAALERAGIAPPYILAGHSIGGYIVRLYAADHPRDVAGVVLIDSSHHDQLNRFPHYRAKILQRVLVDRITPFGARRLAADLGLMRSVAQQAERTYPPGYAAAGAALALSDRQRRADLSELVAWSRIAVEVGRRAPSLGSIPLTIVSSSELSSDYATPEAIANRRDQYRVWYRLQCDLAALSSDNRHVVAENAGHFVHRLRPDVVAEAIAEQVRRTRAARERAESSPRE